jgi:K+-transporting ATPase ATPase B chain
MKKNKLFDRKIIKDSIVQSFVKLNPIYLIKNPVMFVVEVCTTIMLVETIYSLFTLHSSPVYNVTVFLTLLFTLLFANFAEAIAEARGKAQANSKKNQRRNSSEKSAGRRRNVYE